MEDWVRNLFQNNSLSHRPEKRNAPINENGPKSYKKICYDSSSSPIHHNHTGDTQPSVSTGLCLGPSTVNTDVAHNIVFATKALTPLNTQIPLFRNNVLETQDVKSPFSLQEHDLCWFAQPVSDGRQPCFFWTSWKRQIPRERRLHSLPSFLAGCGWTINGTNGHVRRGVIIVDDCDVACKTSILDTLDDLQTSVSSDERAAIWVFGCRPSDVPLRLYQPL